MSDRLDELGLWNAPEEIKHLLKDSGMIDQDVRSNQLHSRDAAPLPFRTLQKQSAVIKEIYGKPTDTRR